ncbi:hypothetical protein NDU88_002836 [Pleurodeles waltl]|uniref:Uncharacterized protein n=1 Tax=Pleurodeles waltl TaxID=8319 RepID=A0AAV7WMA3_PLEWA|nr:hypothetical protein NDU88_002836 [Pleurodeles waltl]
MVAARPFGTCHVEQVEPAGFTQECGRIGPNASGRTWPPGAWSRSRGSSASSPSSAPASPPRETGQIPARREPVRVPRRSCLGTKGAASRRPRQERSRLHGPRRPHPGPQPTPRHTERRGRIQSEQRSYIQVEHTASRTNSGAGAC